MIGQIAPDRAALLLAAALWGAPRNEFRALWPKADGTDDHGRGEAQNDPGKAPIAPQGEGQGGAAKAPQEWPRGLQKVSGAKGSNPGGLYVDETGQKWYVKEYKDPGQAATEHVANEVYRAVGVDAPRSALGPGGKYASEWREGGETLGKAGLTKERADAVLDGFAADVFLNNWDAVGTGHDNVVFFKGSNKATRIDQGGALLYRAQGALKPEGGLGKIGEWDSLRAGNAWYAQVFKAAGVKDGDALGERGARQIDRIVAARPKGGWKELIDKVAPKAPAPFREKVAKTLEARQAGLERKRDQLRGVKALADFDESKHPRDPQGKFTDGDGGESIVVKQKAAPANKDQIAKLVEMKKAGHSYAAIQKETGLNPKQAATVYHKWNKKEAALKEGLKAGTPQSAIDAQLDKEHGFGGPSKATAADAAKAEGGISGQVKDLPPASGNYPKGASHVVDNVVYDKYDNKIGNIAGGTIFDKDGVPTGFTKVGQDKIKADVEKIMAPPGSFPLGPSQGGWSSQTKMDAAGNVTTAKGEKLEWKEKTTGAKENIGKFAYFKNGVQVSAPFAKGDHLKGAATIHNGKGPDWEAPKVSHPPSAHGLIVEKGAGSVGEWPIGDHVPRAMGTTTPAKLTEAGQKWAGTLTSSEKSAISSYTGSSYSSINSQLRQGGSLTGSAAKIASGIDKHPSPPPPDLVWRGVSHAGVGSVAASLGPGDVIQMNGFQSTSIKPEFAHSWGSGKTVFEIKPSKGAYVKVVSHHPHEYEYLLPHGARYTVAGIRTVKLGGASHKVIQLEMHK